jgi:beta-N-acetylhexosaminidase
VIYTDGMEMKAVADTYGLARGSALAIAAGADAICVGGTPSDEAEVLRLRDALVAAVHDGELPEERLHDAAERVRALGRWAARARDTPSATTGPAAEIGLLAARRALRLTTPGNGRPHPRLTAPPYVATFTPEANSAVGRRTPWGLATELDRLLPGTTGGQHAQPAQDAAAREQGAEAIAAAVLRAAGERPVVAVVRDEHRHPWMASSLRALLAARPDTVVVEMGVPHAPPAGALHVATHGAARVCAQAAAEAITGRLSE